MSSCRLDVDVINPPTSLVPLSRLSIVPSKLLWRVWFFASGSSRRCGAASNVDLGHAEANAGEAGRHARLSISGG